MIILLPYTNIGGKITENIHKVKYQECGKESVMSVRNPVIFRSQCQNVATLEIFNSTSIIIFVLINFKSTRFKANMSGVFIVVPVQFL